MRGRWEPAVYEHKAALLGRPPGEVASSAALLAEALAREYETYRADLLTVGVDVYNVEAEALGASLRPAGPEECPDLAGPLYDLGDLPETFELPPIPEAGRFRVLLEAGERTRDALGERAGVRVAASGPFTLAAKLVGLEDLLVSLTLEDGAAENLLAFTARIAEAWTKCIRAHGLDAVIFDSTAGPPLVGPPLYERTVLPLHRHLMEHLARSGQTERELVIGGDTTPIAPLLATTGATLLLCDAAADAAAFRDSLGDDDAVAVRRNVSPARLLDTPCDELAEGLVADLARFKHPVAGTGVLPYRFPPERLHALHAALTA